MAKIKVYRNVHISNLVNSLKVMEASSLWGNVWKRSHPSWFFLNISQFYLFFQYRRHFRPNRCVGGLRIKKNTILITIPSYISTFNENLSILLQAWNVIKDTKNISESQNVFFLFQEISKIWKYHEFSLAPGYSYILTSGEKKPWNKSDIALRLSEISRYFLSSGYALGKKI